MSKILPMPLLARTQARHTSHDAQLESRSPRAVLLEGEHEPSPQSRLSESLRQFKDLVRRADLEALGNEGEIPADTAQAVRKQWVTLNEDMNAVLGDASPLPQSVKDSLGQQAQAELLPYLLLTETTEKFYSKPRGYAGDFMTIANIYEDEARGLGRVGKLLDRCMLDMAAAQAVRGRRGLLADEIMKTIQAKGGRTRVTSLACGPAVEVFDAFERLDSPSLLEPTLIDIDFHALAYVGDHAAKCQLLRNIRLHQGNLALLAAGLEQLELEPQDLVYSIGLIDYFSDKHVIRLLDYVHGLLAPGGKVVLGNFHPRNTTKPFMDHVLNWKLIHRTEADMDRLFMASAFARPCTEIQFEDAGVNLFAHCVKAAD